MCVFFKLASMCGCVCVDQFCFRLGFYVNYKQLMEDQRENWFNIAVNIFMVEMFTVTLNLKV